MTIHENNNKQTDLQTVKAMDLPMIFTNKHLFPRVFIVYGEEVDALIDLRHMIYQGYLVSIAFQSAYRSFLFQIRNQRQFLPAVKFPECETNGV